MHQPVQVEAGDGAHHDPGRRRREPRRRPGQGEDLLHRDPEAHGRHLVVGHATHGDPQGGALEKPGEEGEEGQGEAQGEELGVGDLHPQEGDTARGQEGGVAEVARPKGGKVDQAVKEGGEADGGHDDGDDGLPHHALQEDPLHPKAQEGG